MRQKEKIKRIRRGQSPGGGPPQTTSSLLLWEVRGKLGPRGSTPSPGGSGGSSVFSATAQASNPPPPPPSHTGEGAAPSVLIDSKNPDSVELRQLGDEHAHQGHSVEDEMDLVVLGVEAGEEVPGWGRLGAGIRRCLEDAFLPHSLVGGGRFLTAEELWERTPQNRSRVARSAQLKKPLLTQSPCSTPSPWAKRSGRKEAPTEERQDQGGTA